MTDEQSVHQAEISPPKTLFGRLFGWMGRHPIISFILIAVLFTLPNTIDSYLHPATPAQIAAREQAAAKAAEDQKAQIAAQPALCHLATVCRDYSTARQECAVAGDYKNCLRIKLGDDDAQLTDSCSNDGKLLITPPGMPDAVDCFFIRFSSKPRSADQGSR